MCTAHRWLLGAAFVACAPAETLAPPEEGFQIDEGQFLVPPGRNANFCQEYPMPERYGHGPQFVVGVEAELPPLTHHYFMAYDDEGISATRPCRGEDPLVFLDEPGAEDPHWDNGKIIFIAGEGQNAYRLPEGYGIYLPTGRGEMVTSHHVLNTTTREAELYGRINVYTKPRSEVRFAVNALNCTLIDVQVPPRSEAVLSGTCIAPFDLELVILGSHAHQHLARFEMRHWNGETYGDPFYVSTDWDSPEIILLERPIPIKQGEGITFSCLFKNPHAEPLVYGVGERGEMCAIMSAYAYPAERAHEIPPTLGSIVYEEGNTILLFDTTGFDGSF